jgi:type IV secretory pathway VirB2 component (pilin)
MVWMVVPAQAEAVIAAANNAMLPKLRSVVGGQFAKTAKALFPT